MNQNKNILKNNKPKINNVVPGKNKCHACNNCSNFECNCSCHFLKKNIEENQEDINYPKQNTDIYKNGSLTEKENSNNNNYDNKICENIGTNILNRTLIKNKNNKLCNIDIDLSNNVNDLCQ